MARLLKSSLSGWRPPGAENSKPGGPAGANPALAKSKGADRAPKKKWRTLLSARMFGLSPSVASDLPGVLRSPQLPAGLQLRR